MGRGRFLVLLLIIGLIACATNPVPGKKELSLISENHVNARHSVRRMSEMMLV